MSYVQTFLVTIPLGIIISCLIHKEDCMKDWQQWWRSGDNEDLALAIVGIVVFVLMGVMAGAVWPLSMLFGLTVGIPMGARKYHVKKLKRVQEIRSKEAETDRILKEAGF